MVQGVLDLWKEKKIITFKEEESVVFSRAIQLIREEYDKERNIEDEANRMVEQLEKQQPGLERHKLYLGIKKRLAKEKGVIL